ncbi:histidine-type phosphatase [Oceanivirga miroungae]|uniref:Glucose-1-phosphatase n=1 Tax=Oceanivirga miroungae TaxID=1130046 RepID=A0A6I8M9X3_9FUSO|nr:histidine-type phosphatase [Oceanivirga miroungae]VWL85117.1 Glucose-1-phosphatase [Oceanivirga miroungae]
MKKFKIFLMLVLGLNSVSQLSFAKDDLKLKEMVVLSRHSVRAPLSSPDSTLGKATNHEWINWSAPKSSLTTRGGVLETMAGQYFRKYVEKNGLLDLNKMPSKDEVNIYTNSMQRTIATGRYFSVGFSPVHDLEVYHRFSESKMDPVFFPRLTKVSDDFIKKATKQINSLEGKKSLYELTKSLEPSFDEIEKTLDITESKACKMEKLCDLNDYDTKLSFKLGDEPRLSGSLKTGTIISDALILQYFEEPNDEKVTFGKKLSKEQYTLISKVKDTYGEVLFSAPIVAVNVANPLITYMKDELLSKNRKFTYLVGHDSNLASVMSALGIEDFELPNSVETKTPIGAKLVFEKWSDEKTNEEYISIKLIYQSTEQLRNLSILDLENPPVIVNLKLKGISYNKNGMYKFKDLIDRFNKALMEYENIK